MGIFDAFSNHDANIAAQQQAAGIAAGKDQATAAINKGSGDLTTQYTAALQPFLQNQTTANQGTTALGNALGLNGEAGNAAATTAFQNNPGYKFALDQGTQNVDRNQAAAGMLASGNTDKAVADYTTGLANQGWNQYITNLLPYLGASQGAAGGIAAVDTGLGNQLNANQGSLANLDYTAATGIGNANANATLANYTASQNALGAIQSGVTDFTKLLGMFMPSAGATAAPGGPSPS